MDIKNLELWYQKNKRSLIFRKTKEPYKIWVSEIMLQQTQVETVLPFFDRFMNVYPTVFDLANTDELTLHKVVEGLGYYRRFRYMQEAAKVIVNEFDGIFPNTYDEVIKLPGIGKYTAGAIMSIAYDLPYSALDGNVIRVLSRYLNISEDMRLEKNKKILNEINQSYIEKSHPNLYTQAMMELGAMICRPQNPKCDKCPIALYCQAHAMGIETKLPYLSKLKEKKEFNYITLIIKDESYYYLYKRTEDLLKNMYMYPQFESESIQSVLLNLEAEGIILEVINYIGNYKHVFTHLIWHMDVY
ncbi:MAG: A/G-specific adenine glycosylase, partial [Acholeplasmataceae bacterium]